MQKYYFAKYIKEKRLRLLKTCNAQIVHYEKVLKIDFHDELPLLISLKCHDLCFSLLFVIIKRIINLAGHEQKTKNNTEVIKLRGNIHQNVLLLT